MQILQQKILLQEQLDEEFIRMDSGAQSYYLNMGQLERDNQKFCYNFVKNLKCILYIYTSKGRIEVKTLLYSEVKHC